MGKIILDYGRFFDARLRRGVSWPQKELIHSDRPTGTRLVDLLNSWQKFDAHSLLCIVVFPFFSFFGLLTWKNKKVLKLKVNEQKHFNKGKSNTRVQQGLLETGFKTVVKNWFARHHITKMLNLFSVLHFHLTWSFYSNFSFIKVNT